MRIHEIRLQDFRSYGAAAVPLTTPITFITGRNGAGKSSLIDALAWTLLGRCRGTDARGAGGDTLIRAAHPEATMRVAVALEDADGHVFHVERKQTAKAAALSLAGETGPKDQLTGALFERLGVTPAIVEACLHSEAFLALHHADAKKLLLDVLEVWIPIDGEQLTLGQVEAKYQHWFEERRRRKAALAAIQVPPAPADEVPDVEALETQLAGLREEEKARLATASEASGRRSEIERQLTQLAGAIDRQTAALASTATAKALDGATVDLTVAIADVQDRLARVADDEADQAADDARVTLIDAQGRLRLLTETHQAIAQHSPDRGCILNSAIPCKTPAKAFVTELAAVQAQIDTLHRDQDEATKAIEKARLRGAEIERLHARHTQLLAVQTARAKQEADRATLAETHARLTAERDACPVSTDPPAVLTALQARIQKGEAVIREAHALAQAHHTYQKAKAAAQTAARALAEAERSVEVFGPNGARVEALRAALGQFEASINGALERFGYRLRFVAEPWRVLVNDLPAELLSTSERLRVGIALQLALAEATGFGFVAIDQVDLLDAENRALLGELLTLRGRVQVLAAATKDDDFVPPAIEGWTWVRVAKVHGVSQAERIGEAVAV